MIYLSQLLSPKELTPVIHNYQVGLELIDFSVGMNLDCMSEYLEYWRSILSQLQNPALTLHGPFLDLNPMSFEPMAAEISWKRFSQAYQAARFLNADRIIFHTCRIPTVCYLEGWGKRLADFWNRFMEEHPDIPISVENVFDEDPSAVADFASQVTADNFSLCLDLGHAHHASPVPLTEWLSVLAPWITHLHLHDNCGIKDEHLAIGDGTISWIDLSKKIAALPRLKSATIENLTIQDFQKSLSWCKQNLNKIF